MISGVHHSPARSTVRAIEQGIESSVVRLTRRHATRVSCLREPTPVGSARMYRTIVARRVRSAWAHIDRRDPAFVIEQLAPGFEHSFAGDHAMGGTRRSRESLTAWFERVFRLFPAIRFEVRDVLVRGMPWDTRAVALVHVYAGDV